MILARVRAATRRPLVTAAHWQARKDPSSFVKRHARLARRAGIDRVYLVLSFDCDTAEDAAVVWNVHEWLASLGVRPVYAVPGALLERAADVYRRIADTGAEFLNHGGAEHTYFDEELGRHASCFFYETLTPERVRRDVEDGHRIVEAQTGRRPAGFRTPHFGTYARPDQLRHLHGILRDLGYRFSTSTTPRFGVRHGPVTRHLGLPELPVTGLPEAPFRILDSWAFFAAPDRHDDPAEYLRQARLLAGAMSAEGAGLINVYADPVHVHDREEFFAAVEAWTTVAEPVSYGQMLDRIGA